MRRSIFAATAYLLCGALAAAEHERLTIFDLRLGQPISQLPPNTAFTGYACGTNGGPPGQDLRGWEDFAQCPPDSDGLYEVYFRYDDEGEYLARAHEDYPAGWSAGTAFASFPLITSGLFDDGGRLAGLRLLTDPRPELANDPFLRFRPRMEHYLLGLYLMEPFGMRGADCADLPLDAGQSSVLGMVSNRYCERAANGVRYSIVQRFFRRPGETDVDPVTGTLTDGQFVSETRAEMRLLP